MIHIFIFAICILFPSADVDRDGYTGTEEREHGCNPFDSSNFPVCADLDGDGIGEWTLIAQRCEVTEGYAPCA
jgi:hypothetical protein